MRRSWAILIALYLMLLAYGIHVSRGQQDRRPGASCYWSGVDKAHPNAPRLISHECIEPIWCPKRNVTTYVDFDAILIIGPERSCVRMTDAG